MFGEGYVEGIIEELQGAEVELKDIIRRRQQDITELEETLTQISGIQTTDCNYLSNIRESLRFLNRLIPH